MSSLFALLSQQQPNLQTRKGLILLGLQNDFVLPDGKLPVNDTGHLARISELVPAFREFGDIIWVRSEFEATRPVNGLETLGDTVIVGGSGGSDDVSRLSKGSAVSKDGSPSSTKKMKVSPLTSHHRCILPCALTHPKPSPVSSDTLSTPLNVEDDDELFLTRTATKEPCCVRGTPGADYVEQIKPLIQHSKDLQVIKSHYSAFGATSLLLTLRAKLITDLFVCGNMTNLSVYATAMDAARYGISITLIDDCLGYRRQDRHDLAIKQLRDIMTADVMSAKTTIDILRNPPQQEVRTLNDDYETDESDSDPESDGQQDVPDSYLDPTDLEVDSNESDDEVILPPIHRTGRLAQRTGLHSTVDGTKHSLSIDTGTPHFSTSASSQPSSSLSQQYSHTRQSVSRSFQKPQIDTRASHNDRLGKIGILDSPESPPRYNKPWLDLIPPPPPPADNIENAARPKHRGLAALSAVAGLSPSTVAEYEIMLEQEQKKQQEMSPALKVKPLFGEGRGEESCGSQILYHLLPEDDTIFHELHDEVNWQTMHHQTGEVPRLVCCQGTIDSDGSMPVYRHPSDHTLPLEPWSPAVNRVRRAAERVVGHPLNHVLIQLYRSGNDYISEHSDKTLDIAAGSNIVNASFGAQRTMRLRTKRCAPYPDNSSTARTTHRVPMPHNSMLIMSLKTNAQYLHGINWDRRPTVELVDAEKAFGGRRISLTFRHIATFLNADSTRIWGQGATETTKEMARPVVNGDTEHSGRVLSAFGAENQASTIVWEEIYGGGFDVLHLK